MNKRFAEMEQEAAKLKQMQEAVEQQLATGSSSLFPSLSHPHTHALLRRFRGIQTRDR